jgi:hypothetical protein
VRRLSRLVLAVLWLAAALVIALGTAGIVAGIGGSPGTSARPELTWAGDQAIDPGLTAATADLQELSDRVAGLSDDARVALTALVATDLDLLSSSVDDGAVKLEEIIDRTGALRSDLLALPGIVPDAGGPLPPSVGLALSSDTQERFRMIWDALDATAGLQVDWARFTGSSIAASRLTTLLANHDEATAAAASEGRAGRYAEALAGLDMSDRIIADSRGLRDQLANTVDVATLSEWIDRNAEYDAALRMLYASLQASGGRVTDEVRAAFAAEQEARERLPADTRGLTIILAEVARGGMNEIAIGVEDARVRLLDAAEAAAARVAPTVSPAP